MTSSSDKAQELLLEKAAQKVRAVKDATLTQLIMPLTTPRYEVVCFFGSMDRVLEGYGRDYGGIDMNPDFQRGHVWTPDQQQSYIENLLRGLVSSTGLSIQFNCPNWENDIYKPVEGGIPNGFQCIDGLQRVTAVRKFLNNEIRPFGLGPRDLDDSSFSMKRTVFRFNLSVHSFETRPELLKHYLDLNSGGTPHSAAEIERVRGLLNQAKAAPEAPNTEITTKKVRP